MRKNLNGITLVGLFSAVAIILSFIELLLPPITAYAPGIKIGLPNVVIIFSLYRYGLKYAAMVSFIRLIIASLLFGTPVSFIYSLAGAVLSLAIMALIKKFNLFSMPVISVIGALCHNAAQIGVAAILLSTRQLIYYLPVLSLSALISGLLVGILASFLIKYTKNIKLSRWL